MTSGQGSRGFLNVLRAQNYLTAPLQRVFSILAIQNIQKQIKRCQGTQ